MTLNGVMAVTYRYFTEVGKPALQKTICGGIYARVYCILVRVQCRRKESSRSLSHLLMSFLQLFTIRVANRCSHNKHFKATAGDKHCKTLFLSARAEV